MPGLGLQGAYGGGALHDELLRVMAERTAAKLYAQKRSDQLAQQEAENQQRNRQLDIQERGLEPKPVAEHPYVVGGALVSPTGTELYRAPDKPATPERPFVVGGNLVTPQGGVLFTAPKEPPGPKDERLVQITGPNGTPIWVRESQAVNQPAANAPRAPTGADRNTLNYFNRMLQAERDARAAEQALSGRDVAAQQYAPGWLENWLQSEAGQKYTQAQRAYTEARLRKESGAAIPPSEFETDRKTNFRIAGDLPGTLPQKRAMRLQTLRGIGNAAGRALQEYYGEGTTLDTLLKEFEESQPAAAATPQQRPIPGIPGGVAEFRNGRWIRVK